eukprot:scaffold7247_cov143-Skeletonema_menzelii.AAC.2
MRDIIYLHSQSVRNSVRDAANVSMIGIIGALLGVRIGSRLLKLNEVFTSTGFARRWMKDGGQPRRLQNTV